MAPAKRTSLSPARPRARAARAEGSRTPPSCSGMFETAERFTPATRRRYAALAEGAAFVAALGAGLPEMSEPECGEPRYCPTTGCSASGT